MFVKHLLFQSKTEYHAGKQAQADRKYGVTVVRFDVNEIEKLFLRNGLRSFFPFSVRKILLIKLLVNVQQLHLHQHFVLIKMKSRKQQRQHIKIMILFIMNDYLIQNQWKQLWHNLSRNHYR
jgi:hypothetical protein